MAASAAGVTQHLAVFVGAIAHPPAVFRSSCSRGAGRGDLSGNHSKFHVVTRSVSPTAHMENSAHRATQKTTHLVTVSTLDLMASQMEKVSAECDKELARVTATRRMTMR